MSTPEILAWAIVGLLAFGVLATLTAPRIANWRYPEENRPRATRAQLIASEMRACLERDKAESDARQWRAIAHRAITLAEDAAKSEAAALAELARERTRRPAAAEMSRHAQPFRGD